MSESVMPAGAPAGGPEDSSAGLPRVAGFRAFLLMWAGQLLSLVGSGLTRFAIGVWVYEVTGSVTQFALIAVSTRVPGLLLSPLAGALADRWDRRWTMLGANVGPALTTAGLAALLWTDHLQVWHVYVVAGFGGLFEALHWPAYVASSTLLVPRRHLGRIGGMMQIGQALATTLAPAPAGVLLATVGLTGVILTDLATFLLAVATLFLVRIPKPRTSDAGREGEGSLWRRTFHGWRFIRSRPGLLGLLLHFAAINLVLGVGIVLVTPMVLSFTTASVLGMVLSSANSGLVVGALAMSLHGGPRRKIHGILGAGLFMGVGVGLAGLRPDPYLIAGALFVALFGIPIVNGCSQALWQSKVPPDVQGRVFGMRRLLATATAPVGFLVAGPLADRVFEPLLQPDGALASTAGRVLGVGDGRGIGLLFTILAVLLLAVSAWGYLKPHVRNVDEDLPDAVPDEPEG
ncbi:MAG: MFS transporter [Thermoanaerobaculia bacterium]